jgi:hypothetical protein
MCGVEVTYYGLRILRGNDNPKETNEKFIVLIPKVASPTELGQFCLISRYNVIYKISYKLLSNRLKKTLSEVISQE